MDVLYCVVGCDRGMVVRYGCNGCVVGCDGGMVVRYGCNGCVVGCDGGMVVGMVVGMGVMGARVMDVLCCAVGM